MVKETIRIEILNPKARSIANGLADLNLISIKKEKKQSELLDLLLNLRINTDSAPTLDEITADVESVRSKRYDH